jgi:hypothetical protein
VADDDEAVPRVAVKTHLDGDPRPRPEEVAEWDAIRKEHGLAEMAVMILLPDDSTDGPFTGYAMHGWAIRDGEDGGTVCEREEINVEVVPDADADGSFGFGVRIGGTDGDS